MCCGFLWTIVEKIAPLFRRSMLRIFLKGIEVACGGKASPLEGRFGKA